MLQQTRNLQADAIAADRRRAPLLLIFSQHDCPFCAKLRREIINPMLISGDYADRALVRELMIDDHGQITDFDGAAVAPREVFDRYGLAVTPTVLLLDRHGRELAERQVGINTVDYYFYYLDRAIDTALATLRDEHRG